MLVFQYYTPAEGMEPSREETFQRVHRFEIHCRQLGIPNPYSYNAHNEADKRWRRLHKNAVPPMLAFMGKDKYINENINIKVPEIVKNVRQKEDDFEF
jgi:hypothetical protein